MKIIIVLFLILGFNKSFFTQERLSRLYNKAAYPFWQYLPHDSILKNKPPIIIFLHGKSLSGTDLNRVKKYGVIHEIEKGRSIPAIVLAPQVASGSWNPLNERLILIVPVYMLLE